MRRVLIYIVFTVFALNSTPLYQLYKIPFLVNHFEEHSRRDQSISFLDFLSMHYWGTDLNDDDDDKDRQLPFKVFDTGGQHLFVPVQRLAAIVHVPILYITDSPLDKEFNLPDAHLSSLFRPPRV